MIKQQKGPLKDQQQVWQELRDHSSRICSRFSRRGSSSRTGAGQGQALEQGQGRAKNYGQGKKLGAGQGSSRDRDRGRTGAAAECAAGAAAGQYSSIRGGGGEQQQQQQQETQCGKQRMEGSSRPSSLLQLGSWEKGVSRKQQYLDRKIEAAAAAEVPGGEGDGHPCLCSSLWVRPLCLAMSVWLGFYQARLYAHDTCPSAQSRSLSPHTGGSHEAVATGSWGWAGIYLNIYIYL